MLARTTLLLFEADTRLRQRERRWRETDSPQDGRAWAADAMRSGVDPLHVGTELHSAHPEEHSKMLRALKKQGSALKSRRDSASRHRKMVSRFELPFHAHNYAGAVNDHEDFIAKRQKAARTDPENYQHGETEETEHNQLQRHADLARTYLRHSVISTVPGARGDHLDDLSLHHALTAHKHASDTSRLRTIAHYHGAGHQDASEIHDVRTRGAGVKKGTHYINVDQYQQRYVDEDGIHRALRKHFPDAKVDTVNHRREPHHHDATAYLRVRLKGKRKKVRKGFQKQ